MADRLRSVLTLRAAGVALLVVLVPLLVSLIAISDDQPVREGEPSPRTVFADEQIRLLDSQATDTARRRAEELVEPVLVADQEAQAGFVRDVRNVFAAALEVRRADEQGRVPSRVAQRIELLAQLPNLSVPVADALVNLSDAALATVERETVATAQELARQRVTADELDGFVRTVVPFEMALRSLPGTTAQTVAEPLLAALMRPTVSVDPDATAAARQRAGESVVDVFRVWRVGEVIVREGELVDAMTYRAVVSRGLDGSSAPRTFVRVLLVMGLMLAAGVLYLSRMQQNVWASNKRVFLVSVVVALYAAVVVLLAALVGLDNPAWMFAAPGGAAAMLVALLVNPMVGFSLMVPLGVLVVLVVPEATTAALFVAASVLVSVPLTTGIAKRADLRAATLRAGVAYPLIAGVLTVGLGPREAFFTVLAAGVFNGVLTALVVQGALPFFETLFRLPTVTALLDLSDRNHPLLRELELKALGTYNHSVMVAALTERACREVGANLLIGGVAALYHDIGKVRQPHFFIENQQGIANPHDELEPQVSAVIIQNHVRDGVEMAVEHRLPPEVVACIGSHHGTMLVSYFYNQAVAAAGGDASAVDEQEYRYTGGKPRSKEAAILLFADCSEATMRAMAMSKGTLTRDEIEATVDQLLDERVRDGQFEESDLTFKELRVVRDSLVESLVGIYHPRIAYPRASGANDPQDATHEGVR